MFDDQLKRKVTLDIAGAELVIITSTSDENVKKLESVLDKNVRTILESKPSASILDAVLLVALNTEQKLLSEDKTTENLRSQVREYANEANKAVLELAEAKREIDGLKEQINNLKTIKNKNYENYKNTSNNPSGNNRQ